MNLRIFDSVDIYKLISQETGASQIIVDAQDLLKEPRKMLIEICKSLRIEFDEKMLTWPLGARKTDGVWGKYWYKQVEVSTGFKQYIKINRTIPSKYQGLYDKCMKHYDFLYQNRIILS